MQLSADEQLQFPTIAADPFGGVHVFWTQGVESVSNTDTIFAVQWDGSNWSTPNDIFVAPDGSDYSMPRAVIDNRGTVYLVWAAAGTVLFSSAPAALSWNAQAWSSPVEIAYVNIANLPQLVVDRQGTLHVVVADRSAAGNVLYVQSKDGGVTWTNQVAVSQIEPTATRTSDHPQVLVDRGGRIHVFWSENYPPDYVGRELYYAHSVDGGLNWSLPQRLSYTETNDDWDSRSAAAIDVNDHLHVIWVCGAVHRCYRTSTDNGATWSEAQEIFSTLLGSAGWDTMTADDAGNVFWLGTVRYPEAVYMSTLVDGRWQDPPSAVITGPPQLTTAHNPQLVVGLGNQLHDVMVAEDAGPVWYMRGESSAPAIAPQPMPTLAAMPTPTASGAELAALLPEPTVVPLIAPAAPVSATQAATFSRTRLASPTINSVVLSSTAVLVTLAVAAVAIILQRRR